MQPRDSDVLARIAGLDRKDLTALLEFMFIEDGQAADETRDPAKSGDARSSQDISRN